MHYSGNADYFEAFTFQLEGVLITHKLQQNNPNLNMGMILLYNKLIQVSIWFKFSC